MIRTPPVRSAPTHTAFIANCAGFITKIMFFFGFFDQSVAEMQQLIGAETELYPKKVYRRNPSAPRELQGGRRIVQNESRLISQWD